MRMDGSRRMTLRNRKFIKQILPPVVTRPPKNHQQEPQITEATHRHVEQNPSLLHQQQPPSPAQHLGDYSGQLDEQLPGGITEIILSPDDSPPATESQPTPSPPPMNPSPSPPPSTVPVNVRPRRERKPNSLYSPEVYDLSKVDIESDDDDDLGLSGLVEDSVTLSRKQVIQMFKYIMDRLPEDQ